MSKDNLAKLVPLRIPAGWTVQMNHFQEDDLETVTNEFKNCNDVSLAMLSLVEENSGRWPKLSIYLDFEWVEKYRLLLSEEGENHMNHQDIAEFNGDSYEEIKKKIDEWLELLSSISLSRDHAIKKITETAKNKL